MAIGISEVAFFAPFTLGVSVFVASSISSAVTAHSELTAAIQDRARDVKAKAAQCELTVEQLVQQVNLHQDPDHHGEHTILDDLCAKDIERDLFSKKIVVNTRFGSLFDPRSLTDHRSQCVNRSAHASILVLFAIVCEIFHSLMEWLKVSSNWFTGFFDSSNFFTSQMLCLVWLAWILVKNVYSLNAASTYIFTLNRDLSRSQASIAKMQVQIEFHEKTSNI